jgi:GTP cyclohydrolase I
MGALKMTNKNNELIMEGVKKILEGLGEDLSRVGLKDTPKRVAKSLQDLTNGMGVAISDCVDHAIFPCTSEGLIVQKGLEFYSLCEHHMLPFFGRIHVAYLPDKQIIGLSKVGRIIDTFAQRLQVQENLTMQIASGLFDILKPKGLGVIVEASHFCMMMRGVKKQGSVTVTSEFRGVFQTNAELRQEFLATTKN